MEATTIIIIFLALVFLVWAIWVSILLVAKKSENKTFAKKVISYLNSLSNYMDGKKGQISDLDFDHNKNVQYQERIFRNFSGQVLFVYLKNKIEKGELLDSLGFEGAYVFGSISLESQLTTIAIDKAVEILNQELTLGNDISQSDYYNFLFRKSKKEYDKIHEKLLATTIQNIAEETPVI
ncbi:MAG: hypothetical protein ACOYMB_02405 [Patescibacteria group bacterium]